MFLKLTLNNWDKGSFVIREDQKDYAFIEENEISIFVYGYPFCPSKRKWISPNEVYQQYSDRKFNFIKDIEGLYSIIILDKFKEECFIIIDPYGIYSMFYSRDNSYFIISDIISEIINFISNKRLNKQSIIEYLNFGFKLGNKTHIENIYEFEASKIYKINKKLELSQKNYWEFFTNPKLDKKEVFYNVFNMHHENALNLERKVSLPLTGGLDTRTILSACLPFKQKLHCYTHGIKNTPDVKIARKICNHFGIEHSIYELDKEWVKNIPFKLEKNANIFNGLIPSLTYMHVKESYQKEEKNGDLFLSGILGNEIWRCFLGKKVRNSNKLDEVSFLITKLYTRENTNLNYIYKDYNYKEIMNLMTESVKTELLKDKNVKNPVSLSELFVFRNYCSNWASNSLKYTGKHFKVFSSYLQKDLMQYIPFLSLDEKDKGLIQKNIIIRNNPFLASILLDVTDMRHGAVVRKDLEGRIKEYLKLFYRYFRYGMNRISRKLFRFYLFRLPYFTDYPNWFRSQHKSFLLRVLNYDDMLTRDLFRKDGLENTINSFLRGDDSLSEFIFRLISLEMWLKSSIKIK